MTDTTMTHHYHYTRYDRRKSRQTCELCGSVFSSELFVSNPFDVNPAADEICVQCLNHTVEQIFEEVQKEVQKEGEN